MYFFLLRSTIQLKTQVDPPVRRQTGHCGRAIVFLKRQQSVGGENKRRGASAQKYEGPMLPRQSRRHHPIARALLGDPAVQLPWQWLGGVCVGVEAL